VGKKLTKEIFVEKAIKKHGEWYDYSKVVYVNNRTKVCIICPIHGEFWQTPNQHLNGCGCPHCGGTTKLTKEEFVERSILVHGDWYDYSKVVYVNYGTKVLIICPDHGEFWQTPHAHLVGQGCPYCKINKIKKSLTKTQGEIIKEFREVHGDWYDYSKVEYVNNHTKVLIICPIHSEFWQTPNKHLTGRGCPKCANKNVTKEEFVEKVILVHGEWYDYSKVVYIDSKTKVCIIHKKCGKEFWQTPSDHLSGRGCPYCNTSKLENNVNKILGKNGVNFTQKYRGLSWLRNKLPLELDFYLPEYNIGIECQGEQHFKSVEYWGGDETLKNIQERDSLKKILCEEHGVKLFYINHDDNVEEKMNEILKIIL
jgi:hypothetical protein